LQSDLKQLSVLDDDEKEILPVPCAVLLDHSSLRRPL
jgi:hypothetical protein